MRKFILCLFCLALFLTSSIAAFAQPIPEPNTSSVPGVVMPTNISPFSMTPKVAPAPKPMFKTNQPVNRNNAVPTVANDSISSMYPNQYSTPSYSTLPRYSRNKSAYPSIPNRPITRAQVIGPMGGLELMPSAPTGNYQPGSHVRYPYFSYRRHWYYEGFDGFNQNIAIPAW